MPKGSESKAMTRVLCDACFRIGYDDASKKYVADDANFEDVLVFDTTYRTNVYRKLLMVLDGVNNLPVKPRDCVVKRPSCAVTLKLCDRLVVNFEDLALGARGEGEAILVLVCFFLDDCCLVDLPGAVCPSVDGVREGGTTPRATFGITRGSSSLTQESVGRERSQHSSKGGDTVAYVSPSTGIYTTTSSASDRDASPFGVLKTI
ncbi:hypothetical protein M9H77_09505 [Catharanthus roseus]|uniref:Uncharacterized protein n=1 Tax=Catharanthus roseus TaxID=4058 RepID=A0ACC0C0Z5_CATRO|nr:hypothetical protein M9H77_09505 [Catharanthus roseus]